MNFSNENFKNYLSNSKVKKAIAASLAGAFLMTGISFTQPDQSFAEAATPQHYYNQDKNKQFSPDQMLQNMHDCFGIDKQVLLDYQAKGWTVRDLHQASFIAYVAKVPIGDVLNAKTDKNWIEVRESFGITKDQYAQARTNFMGANLAKNLAVNETTIKNLLADGYHPRDIAMAVTISKKTDKSISTVLAHKKINNTWENVATSLGLTSEAYEQSLADARSCMGSGAGFQGGHHKNFQQHQGRHQRNLQN